MLTCVVLLALVLATFPGENRATRIGGTGSAAANGSPTAGAESFRASFGLRARDENDHPIGARFRIYREADRRLELVYDEVTIDPNVRVDGGGAFWIVADAKDRARASTAVTVVASERREILFRPPPGHALRVRVETEDGSAPSDVIAEASGRSNMPVGARVSAQDHTLHLEHLSEGPYRVIVRSPGYDEEILRNVTETERTVRLRKLAAIEVSVLGGDGSPAPGAEISLTGASIWPVRRGITSDKGTLRVSGLRPGLAALRAVRGGQCSRTELGVELQAGSVQASTLQLEPCHSARVNVISEEDGSPINGAMIVATEGGVSPFPLQYVTDKKGVAMVGPFYAMEETQLSVTAEGFVTARRAIRGPTEIALVRSGTLEGRVVDGRGFPVAGAMLAIAGTDVSGMPFEEDPERREFALSAFRMGEHARNLVPAGELGVMPGPVPPIPRVWSSPSQGQSLNLSATDARAPERWVTRKDGSFRIDNVPSGLVYLIARHPEYVESYSKPVRLLPRSQGDIALVMRKGAFLEATVTDAKGSPLPFAAVRIRDRDGYFERNVRTASDGTFAAAALPSHLALSVTPENETQERLRVQLDVQDGERKTITLRMAPPREPVEVSVVDGRGMPVAMAQVTATALDPEISYRATEFADKRGALVLPDARGLQLRLEASAPGSPVSAKTVDTTSGRATLVLVPGTSIMGEVRSDRGDPILGANVLVIGTTSFVRTRTDVNGEFRFASAPSGEIRLRVEQPGYVMKETTHVVEPRTRATSLPRVVLAKEAAVEGRVIDANGSPVRGAQIFAVGREAQRVTTSRDGTFRLGGLEAGAIVLGAEHPEFATKEESLSLRPKEELRGITIRMGKPGAPSSLFLANPGIVLQTGADGEVIVGQVQPGSSGERAGVLPGDTLVSIDRVNVTDRSSASKQLSGPAGSEVTLVLERKGHQEIYKVTREPAK